MTVSIKGDTSNYADDVGGMQHRKAEADIHPRHD